MDNDYNEKLDLIPAIGSKLNKTVDDLLSLCSDPDEEVRYTAIEMFVDLKSSKIEKTICSLLRDNNELVRSTCLEVIGSWKDKTFYQQILPLLNDDSELVRSAAAVSIADLGVKAAICILEKRLDACGEEEQVRIYYALYRLGLDKYLPIFLCGLFHDYYRIRCATASLSVDIITKLNKNFILNILIQRLQTEETVAAKSSINNAIEAIRDLDIEN